VPKNIPLTLACGNYEIVRALKDGTVTPDGIDLTILTDMDSTTRHWRFLREGHFDVAETSCSSYIVARDKGMAITAIPVFLHRRFRHGFVFINTGKGIKKPADLIGKRIGIKSFLVTAIHWMRGILEHEYGVPHKAVEWVAELDEDVDFNPPPGLRSPACPTTNQWKPCWRRANWMPSFTPTSSSRWKLATRASRGCGPITKPRKSASTRRRRFSRSCT
jgi:4,5-dihydroxyphthalate decarboxylase